MMTVDKALAMADKPCVRANSDIYVLAAEVRRLRSEIDSAREDLQSFVDDRNHWKTKAEAAKVALKEARELVEDWGAYAPAYMQEKHDLEGDLSRLDAVISKMETP